MSAFVWLVLLSAQGADSRTTPPQSAVPRVTNHFGLRCAAIGDVDDDGALDLAVADGNLDDVRPDAGHVWIFSTKSGRLLGELAPPPLCVASRSDADDVRAVLGHPCFGSAFARVRDLDADGRPDFLVAAWGAARSFRDDPKLRRGCVRAYSGRDLHVVAEIRSDALADGFGSALDAADLDADGVDEWIVGTDGTESATEAASATESCVRIYSGKDASIQHTLRSPARAGSRFGHAVCVVGDLDGDGRRDVAVGAPRDGIAGSVFVFSSATGGLLRTLKGSAERAEEGWEFGWAIERVGDVNDDGVPDFLVSCLDAYVRTYSGKDCSVLIEVDDRARGFMAGAGASLAPLNDIDGDGVDDYAVGCEEYADSGDRYDATVRSGRTGGIVRVLDTGKSFAHVANAGDVDGDGADDLAVGVWQQDHVVLWSARTGKTLRVLRRP